MLYERILFYVNYVLVSVLWHYQNENCNKMLLNFQI